MIKCYRDGGCGPYEMLSCSECPASKPTQKAIEQLKWYFEKDNGLAAEDIIKESATLAILALEKELRSEGL